MSTLPVIRFRSTSLPAEQGFEAWREFIGSMYDVSPAERRRDLPQGAAACYLLGDVLLNRTVFEPQEVSRNARKVESTPDHIILQIWRSGGFTGEVGGREVHLLGGVTALADRRKELAGRMMRADTVGVAIPRNLLAGIDFEPEPTRMAPERGRVLAGEISALYRRALHMRAEEAPAELERLLAAVHRVFRPSRARDVFEGAEFDGGLLMRARRLIQRDLMSARLTPLALAAELGVSRATLYRAFAPVGGVADYTSEQRLLAVRDALSDDLEMRTISQIGADYLLNDPALLSRQFRRRFGMSPREWRVSHREGPEMSALQASRRAQRWWNLLGSTRSGEARLER